MISMQSSGRFNITKVPQNLPGKCIVCGAWGGDGRDFIDFGLDIEYYGTVYFCSVCFTEGCNILGYINKDQWTRVNELNDEIIRRVQSLEVENGHLRRALDSIDFVGGNIHSVDDSADSDARDSEIEAIASDTTELLVGSTEESVVLHGKNNKQQGHHNPKSFGSTNESGHALVSSDDRRNQEDEFDFG